MTLLWPAAWALLLLAFLPVAFYLFRQRPRARAVSTLLFWHMQPELRESNRWWRRLRHWFSLLLQVVFVALLCLALGRPALSWRAEQGGSYIIILDTSPSMGAVDAGGVSPWERAFREIDARMGRLRASDRMILLTAQPRPSVPHGWSGNPRRLRQSLSGARLSGQPADWEAVFALARNLRRGSEEAEIVVYTDLVWEELPPAEEMEGVRIRSLALPAPANAGLTHFSARRSFGAPGEYMVRAGVAYEGEDAFTGEILLYRDNRLVDLRAVRLESGETWEHTWRHSSTGEHFYRAVLESDRQVALAADNEASLTVPDFPLVDVVISGRPNRFLEAALRAQPRVSLHREYEWEGRGGDFDANERPILRVYHRTSPGGDSPQAGALLLIDPGGEGFWGARSGTVESPVVSFQKREHRLLTHVDLSRLRLSEAAAFEPPPGGEVFVESPEAPLVFGRWDDRERWVVLPFGLESSDLALRAAFPIFVGNLTQSLRGNPTPPAAVLPGATETRLRSLWPPEAAMAGVDAPRPRAWERFPLWWWLLLAAVIWLVAEWWSYTRLKTE